MAFAWNCSGGTKPEATQETNKQTNKEINKQRNKQTISFVLEVTSLELHLINLMTA